MTAGAVRGLGPRTLMVRGHGTGHGEYRAGAPEPLRTVEGGGSRGGAVMQ